MRSFSEFEKQAMKIIAQNRPSGSSIQNVETLVNNLFGPSKVHFDVNPIGRQVDITYYTNEAEDSFEIREIQDKLISLQILLEYLESLYLIRLYDAGINGGLEPNKQAVAKSIHVTNEITDTRINNYFTDHWTNLFCVTEALRELVGLDFIPKEILESQKQTKYSKLTLIVSIVAVIIAVLTVIFNYM